MFTNARFQNENQWAKVKKKKLAFITCVSNLEELGTSFNSDWKRRF